MSTDTEPPVFPVSVKLAAAVIDNTHTDVAVLGFSNCVVILVTQLASVGCLVQTAVSQLADNSQDYYCSSSAPDLNDDPQNIADKLAAAAAASSEIPVDVKFILGNPGSSAASSLYEILATAVSQRKHAQNPDDVRPTILGIGLNLPREYKISSTSDDGELADLGAFSSTISAVTALVDDCRAW
ncbi:hypothetical protein IWW50_003659 [Coemansia erecta]|nr:hypothetical protein IWW50_003659 [Coemansia erecta]